MKPATIVAELEEDICDCMSDSFGTKTLKKVYLCDSGTTRNSFAELKKAALLSDIPEIHMLGEKYTKDFEHQDTDSTGRGYYLKRGGRYCSGWSVRKNISDDGDE